MGTTLHNKIYLGRHPVLVSRRLQVALAMGALGALAGVGIVWAAMRTLK